uniref:Uncharacterized protein n=1 Tax=Rhizophora mucronata TaxID=61149 RepID=A0A2P2Q0M3_RHIMU
MPEGYENLVRKARSYRLIDYLLYIIHYIH